MGSLVRKTVAALAAAAALCAPAGAATLAKGIDVSHWQGPIDWLQVAGDGSDLAVDGDVELVLRRYAYERGVPVYGYKARAVEAPEAAIP